MNNLSEFGVTLGCPGPEQLDAQDLIKNMKTFKEISDITTMTGFPLFRNVGDTEVLKMVTCNSLRGVKCRAGVMCPVVGFGDQEDTAK